MKSLAYTLTYVMLALCVLAGTASPIYLRYSYGAGLAIVALVGFAAGGIAPRVVRGWQAWLVLVVPSWAGLVFVLEATQFWRLGLLMYLWPAVASVGVAAGLVAWRLPERLWVWRIVPTAAGVGAVFGLYFWGSVLVGAIHAATPDMSATFQAPVYTLKRLDGGTVPASALRGKTVVLAFWATWCEPCREELPALEKLYTRHWRNDPRVAFYAVDVGLGGDTPAKGRSFLEELGVNLPAAFDKDGDLSRKLRTGGVLPVRVVIAPDGVVRLRKAGYAGFDAGFPALRKAVKVATTPDR